MAENLRAESGGRNTGVAALYLNHKEADAQSNLMAGLWRQLVLEQPLPPTVRRLYAKHREQRTRPSLDDTYSILCCTISEYSRVFIVVDALDEDHKEILRLRLENGAMVNIPDAYNDTALSGAIYRSDEVIARVLIEYGADVDSQTSTFGRVLHRASSMGCKPIVKLLLEHGALVDLESTCGPALDIAVHYGKSEIARLLIAHGAKRTIPSPFSSVASEYTSQNLILGDIFGGEL